MLTLLTASVVNRARVAQQPSPQPAYRVDRSVLRTQQACICASVLLGFVLGTELGRWFVLATGFVLSLGVLHPALALYKQLYWRALRPAGLLKPDVHVEDPMPHLFAQGMGGAVSLLAALALFLDATVLGWALAWLVFALALVNLLVQFCTGCFIYYQLDRVGLLPRAIASTRGRAA
ncbi:MAG: DUF4395 domain-containing protein [Chloroflexi bacterium]|nr:DUF4395 domain-containing protein [Chloroflexota bacterium]